MQEKRITARQLWRRAPARDFPLLARAYLDGELYLDELISAALGLRRSMMVLPR